MGHFVGLNFAGTFLDLAGVLLGGGMAKWLDNSSLRLELSGLSRARDLLFSN